MNDPFSRTRMLLGEEAVEKLARSRVAVFGLGGVGGMAAEALARAGVGALDLIDHDRVSVTNLNRQILATRRSIGQLKVDAAEERILSVNPDCRVRKYPLFFLPETADAFDFSGMDYAVDAIDTVAGKLTLIQACRAAGVPIISAMGAGNKMDPTAFRVADLYETAVCPLARIMRKECRKRGIDRLKVVYSAEPPLTPLCPAPREGDGPRRDVPGSVSFVPAAAGLALAGAVVRDLIGWDERRARETAEENAEE